MTADDFRRIALSLEGAEEAEELARVHRKSEPIKDRLGSIDNPDVLEADIAISHQRYRSSWQS